MLVSLLMPAFTFYKVLQVMSRRFAKLLFLFFSVLYLCLSILIDVSPVLAQSIIACAESPACAAEVGFNPAPALINANPSTAANQIVPFTLRATGAASGSVAAVDVSATATAVSGTGIGVIDGGTTAAVATAAGLSIYALTADSLPGIRRDSFDFYCQANSDAQLCNYYYVSGSNLDGSTIDPSTIVYTVHSPLQYQRSWSDGTQVWQVCYDNVACYHSRSPFTLTPFSSNFDWSRLSDSERGVVINYMTKNGLQIAGGKLTSLGTATAPRRAGQALNVSGTNLGGVVVGSQPSSLPVVIPAPNSDPSPSPSPSPDPSPSPSPSPDPSPSPSPDPSPSPSPDPSPSPSPDPNPSPSPSPDPSPSPSPSPDTFTPPATAPIQPQSFSGQNWLQHGIAVFSGKFPFDVLGDMGSAGADSCPTYTFFSKDFELCPIRDLFKVFKYPVIVGFVIRFFHSI